MVILFIILACTSCLVFISDLARPILSWNPQGWPEWLVIVLKTLAIVVGSSIIIFGMLCFAMCGASLQEPKK